jgi:hypothetical protein
LHSIPPREKSTRTLIIDHMLWVHGRTRFAQARAELGMTDRTGGPSSPNYAHRQRPENFEEDEEVLSDGEDIAALRTRTSLIGVRYGQTELDRNRQQLDLARSLRLRAESLEKVVTSMLDQPPTVVPNNDEDTRSPPTSSRSSLHPHTLPNGVRLRLALGTVINDLFARVDHLAPRHHRNERDAIPKSVPFQNNPSSSAAMDGLVSSTLPMLPASLIPLSVITGVAQTTAMATEQSHLMFPPSALGSSVYENFMVSA